MNAAREAAAAGSSPLDAFTPLVAMTDGRNVPIPPDRWQPNTARTILFHLDDAPRELFTQC